MPCVTCNKIFKIKPCNHPTGRFEDKSEIYLYDNIRIYNIIKYYYNLHDYCPCKTCLVSPACQHAYTCEMFKERLSPEDNGIKSKFTFTDSGWTIVRTPYDLEP